MVGLYLPAMAKQFTKKTVEDFHLETDVAFFHAYFLPSQAGLQAIIKTLDRATKEISLSLFTFTHPTIGQKLIDLHKRGIKIDVKLDKGTANGASKKIRNLFESEGIPVKKSRGLQLFHHKWAIIDKKTHIIGSANWTDAAFKKNKDLVLIIDIK